MPKNPRAPECMWCKRPGAWAKAGIPTGFKVHAWCFSCGKSASTQLAMAKGNFAPAVIAAMRFTDDDAAKVSCPICSARVCGLELHHLAPREQFGDECELWPTIKCCRACHMHWHRLMGRDIGDHRKAAE